MRFTCKNCGFPAPAVNGVPLTEATCPKCCHPLNLLDEERQFAGYEILELVGTGGFGAVWKARKGSNRILALKLTPKSAVSADERIHLLRQVRSSKRLNHPYVVSAFASGESGDYWYLVSKFVDGLPLRQWAESRRPNARESVELCARVAETIHYVHCQGFVHRDLKPGNIILDREEAPHIIDFGLCMCIDDQELMAIERYRQARHLMASDHGLGPNVVGTLAYTSPEQASGNALQASAQSDIYSIGIILYELLTGTRPFHGRNQALARRILAGRPGRPSRIQKNIPAEIEAVCLKAIARKASCRYATAEEFAEDCRNASKGLAVQAPMPRWGFW